MSHTAKIFNAIIQLQIVNYGKFVDFFNDYFKNYLMISD